MACRGAALTLSTASLSQTDSDNNLHFVEAPALAPPEVTYDQSDMLKYEQVSPRLPPDSCSGVLHSPAMAAGWANDGNSNSVIRCLTY